METVINAVTHKPIVSLSLSLSLKWLLSDQTILNWWMKKMLKETHICTWM